MPAYDALRLIVDTYEGRKPMVSWKKTTGTPSQRLAQHSPGRCQRSTAIYAVEIRDRQGSWSGTTVHSDYATMMTMMMTKIAKLIDGPVAELQRSSAKFSRYYAALLPRRGPHIASHSVCPSVCLSVRPVIVTERHVAAPSKLQ